MFIESHDTNQNSTRTWIAPFTLADISVNLPILWIEEYWTFNEIWQMQLEIAIDQDE